MKNTHDEFTWEHKWYFTFVSDTRFDGLIIYHNVLLLYRFCGFNSDCELMFILSNVNYQTQFGTCDPNEWDVVLNSNSRLHGLRISLWNLIIYLKYDGASSAIILFSKKTLYREMLLQIDIPRTWMQLNVNF